MENNISEISFEKINDEYSYGKYGPFNVILNSNGYINVTKLCALAKTINGQPKRFRDWKDTNIAKELIKEVAVSNNFPAANAATNLVNGVPETAGTYAHIDLVPHIASWASPKFAVQVSKIVNQHLINEAVKEKNAALIEKDKIIKSKNITIKKHKDKIDELMETIKINQARAEEEYKKADESRKQSEQMNIQLNRTLIKVKKANEIIMGQNDELLEKNKKLSKSQKHIETQNDKIMTKLDIAKESYVPPPPHKNQNYCYILMKDENNKYPYHVIRVMNKSVNQQKSAYLKTHPNGKEILSIICNPNVVNLHNRVKSELADKINGKINDFKIYDKDYTEEDLIDDIKDINDEKYNI